MILQLPSPQEGRTRLNTFDALASQMSNSPISCAGEFESRNRACLGRRKSVGRRGNDRVSQWAASAIGGRASTHDQRFRFLTPFVPLSSMGGARCCDQIVGSLADLGSDLDSYTDADADNVVHHAPKVWCSWSRAAGRPSGQQVELRSTDLPELVEVHWGVWDRPGSRSPSGSLTARPARLKWARTFFASFTRNRLLISNLERITATLHRCAMVRTRPSARVRRYSLSPSPYVARWESWEGLSPICIVSDYVKWYGGRKFPCHRCARAARFGSDQSEFQQKLLRIPILAALCQSLCHRTETVDVNGTCGHSPPGLCLAWPPQLR